ncbi:bifunctional nuclease family protein [Myroides marinus]|uniref:bifunctional nuclease family protein n=1 Tax=Myroides marinus TaxID=703342 RepID=UPI0025753EDD|nr:bifunctional nuclease family protein [Myroides marinus]MDM1347808.1 bifunctional nuclease family protein [Myroides marinus]MDM1351480.1 bifunctional nuclease family protein [Myroides marinus]MDM1355171.1 bifunctional nuclease family protein [Myroides marinus]MDM1358687.1 bifunctional nuclease family protein [Myroides marinus]MDM1361273.1 bifunctional nuclease family protein [Myroides marinus]
MSLIKLTVSGISYSHTQNGAYALILEEEVGSRKLPIVIGAFEAQSIAIAIEDDIRPPRPLTHDLFKSLADRYSIVIKEVIINRLLDGIFYSSLVCERDGIEEVIDARTSDAIALAIRFYAPIYTYKDIMDRAGIILNAEAEEEEPQEEDNSNPYSGNDIASQVEQFLEEEAKANDFSSYSKSELEKMLNEALINEDYEKAALLRDELNKR